MSTDLKCRSEDWNLTRFSGGERGACVQVSMKAAYTGTERQRTYRLFDMLQLTRAQAKKLSQDLADFAEGKEEQDLFSFD